MGLFDIFKSKPKSPERRDLTWMTENAKWNGLKKILEENQGAIILSWFSATQDKVNQIFQRDGVQKEVTLCRTFFPGAHSGNTVYILEHYPFLEKEETFLSSIISSGSTVTFLNSLDEPLFQKFGGDNIKSMMEKLGMDEADHLEHSLISSSILNMQKKIQDKVTMDFNANSQEDWIKRME